MLQNDNGMYSHSSVDIFDRIPENKNLKTEEKHARPVFKDTTPFDSKRIKRLRRKLKISQSEFAELLGVSIKTVQGWEGCDIFRKPKGPTLRFLKYLEENPRYIETLKLK